jgi:hypothetical protein
VKGRRVVGITPAQSAFLWNVADLLAAVEPMAQAGRVSPAINDKWEIIGGQLKLGQSPTAKQIRKCIDGLWARS